ncbi:MAG: hypothetical protein ACOY0T_09865 [Myxococcota bacterium]
MRRLRDIRSDGAVIIQQRSVAALCVLSLVPAAVIASLAWWWVPTWNGGRGLVTACLALVTLVLLRLAWTRQRTLHVQRGSALTWHNGLESDDPYGLILHQGDQRELLIEAEDPAEVVAGARRIARETGAVLLGPDWLAERSLTRRDPASVSETSEEALLWPAQLRTSRTTLFGGLFVLLVFIGSINAESEVSLLSAMLPLLAVVLALVIAWQLARLRLRVHSGPSGLRAERIGLFGVRPLLSVPLDSLGDVHALGHPSHPERHLLVETRNGPVSLPCAEASARRVARFWGRRSSSGAA